MIEDHRIVIVPAPKLLPSLTRKRTEDSSAEVLLVGGIDYGLNVNGKASPWKSLLGAQAEIESLKEQYQKSPLNILVEKNASEERVTNSLSKARIQHFATHGLFQNKRLKRSSFLGEAGILLGATRVLEEVRQDETATVTRSALVLAGANEAEPDKFDASSFDGFLTDSEILTMPLRNTELVVLSACNTGQGKVQSGDGLLGIQRAFHVAGVQTTVASLWKVDDWATKRLMLQFHKNLAKPSTSKIDALRNAQLQMLRSSQKTSDERGANRELKKNHSVQSPFFWAAFQLSGDWR